MVVCGFIIHEGMTSGPRPKKRRKQSTEETEAPKRERASLELVTQPHSVALGARSSGTEAKVADEGDDEPVLSKGSRSGSTLSIAKGGAALLRSFSRSRAKVGSAEGDEPTRVEGDEPRQARADSRRLSWAGRKTTDDDEPKVRAVDGRSKQDKKIRPAEKRGEPMANGRRRLDERSDRQGNQHQHHGHSSGSGAREHGERRQGERGRGGTKGEKERRERYDVEEALGGGNAAKERPERQRGARRQPSP